MIKEVLLAFRPKTLTAALVPCLVGTALAVHDFHQFNLQVLMLALAASFLIQIGTNLVNDAIDFKKGADTEKRIGPQRITQMGVLKPKTVMTLAGLCFFFSIICGLPLVLQGGLPILVIGLVSVAMGYAYTAGPAPLAYLGLGDLFVILFFGLIAVGGIYFLQTGHYSVSAFVLGLQIGFHATVLIAINNLRDANGDRLVHKKTLAVRFGKQFSRFEIAFLALSPFLLNLYWLTNGSPAAGLISILALPLAILVIKNIFSHEPSAIYNKFLGQSAGLHLVFGLLLTLGLWLF